MKPISKAKDWILTRLRSGAIPKTLMLLCIHNVISVIVGIFMTIQSHYYSIPQAVGLLLLGISWSILLGGFPLWLHLNRSEIQFLSKRSSLDGKASGFLPLTSTVLAYTICLGWMVAIYRNLYVHN